MVTLRQETTTSGKGRDANRPTASAAATVTAERIQASLASIVSSLNLLETALSQERPYEEVRQLVRISLRDVGTLKASMDSVLSGLSAAVSSAQSRSTEVQHGYRDTLRVLAAALEARDPFVYGHAERVSAVCLLLARTMSYPQQQWHFLETGGLLHDIGKIGVPDATIHKTYSLTPEEMGQIRAHPVLGAQMLAGVEFLKPSIPLVLYHHEHYGGHGYPMGLVGTDIPPEARLAAVADAFDAMHSDRPYRRAFSPGEVRRRLRKSAGYHFDPLVVQALLDVWENASLLLRRPSLTRK